MHIKPEHITLTSPHTAAEQLENALKQAARNEIQYKNDDTHYIEYPSILDNGTEKGFADMVLYIAKHNNQLAKDPHPAVAAASAAIHMLKSINIYITSTEAANIDDALDALYQICPELRDEPL